MADNKLDSLIAEALTEEEREFLAGLEEPSMMQQGLDLFRGRHRIMNILTALVTAGLFAIFVWCLVRFLGTEDVGSMLRWGAGMLYSFLMILGIKVWGWMEMQSNTLRRELKRVELQLASLAHKIDGPGG